MAADKRDLRNRVREALLNAICTTVRRSGGEAPTIADETLRPIVDVAGFDSQCGVEVTVELETALRVADLGDNVFIKQVDGKDRARTVVEVVDAILQVVETT